LDSRTAGAAIFQANTPVHFVFSYAETSGLAHGVSNIPELPPLLSLLTVIEDDAHVAVLAAATQPPP